MQLFRNKNSIICIVIDSKCTYYALPLCALCIATDNFNFDHDTYCYYLPGENKYGESEFTLRTFINNFYMIYGLYFSKNKEQFY